MIANREDMVREVRAHLGALGVSGVTIRNVIAAIDADAEDTAQSFDDWTDDEYELCTMRTVERILTEGCP